MQKSLYSNFVLLLQTASHPPESESNCDYWVVFFKVIEKHSGGVKSKMGLMEEFLGKLIQISYVGILLTV